MLSYDAASGRLRDMVDALNRMIKERNREVAALLGQSAEIVGRIGVLEDENKVDQATVALLGRALAPAAALGAAETDAVAAATPGAVESVSPADRLLADIEGWCGRTGVSERDLGAGALNHPGFVGLLRHRRTLKAATEVEVRAFLDAHPDGVAPQPAPAPIVEPASVEASQAEGVAPPTPAPATPRKPWAEDYMARLQAARAYLDSRGFGVVRASVEHSTWAVAGFSGKFTNDELVQLADSERAKAAAAAEDAA